MAANQARYSAWTDISAKSKMLSSAWEGQTWRKDRPWFSSHCQREHWPLPKSRTLVNSRSPCQNFQQHLHPGIPASCPDGQVRIMTSKIHTGKGEQQSSSGLPLHFFRSGPVIGRSVRRGCTCSAAGESSVAATEGPCRTSRKLENISKKRAAAAAEVQGGAKRCQG